MFTLDLDIIQLYLTQSGATTLGLRGPGSDDNDGVLRIPPKIQHYLSLTIRLFDVISRTLFVGVFYPFAKMQSAYSTAPADWARWFSIISRTLGEVLPLSRDAGGVFYSSSWLGHIFLCNFFRVSFIQLYIKYSYQIQIICTHLHGFKYSFQILIITW